MRMTFANRQRLQAPVHLRNALAQHVLPLHNTYCLCGNVCSEEPRGAQGKQSRVSTGLKSRFTMTSSRIRVHRDRMLRTLETRIQGVKLKTRRARGLIRRASAVRFVLFWEYFAAQAIGLW